MMRWKSKSSRGLSFVRKISTKRSGIGRHGAIWLTPVIVGVSAVAPAMATDVIRGIDLWKTVSPTEKDFMNCPIMAGFFNPGSDPFDGGIQFQGRPYGGALGETDTIVERRANATLPCPVPNPSDCTIPPCPDPPFSPCSQGTVSIQIVALSLESAAPITVTYGGGNPEQWDVRACLSNAAQDPGTMTIKHNCPEGGTFESELPVRFKLIFTRRPDGLQRVLDASGPCNPIVLTAEGDWLHDPQEWTDVLKVPPGLDVDANCDGTATPLPAGTTNFFPGFEPDQCFDCCGFKGVKTAAMKQEVPERAPDGEHTVTPPGGPPPPPPPPIPAVSTWGLLVLALLLLAVGKVYYGRRRKPVV